MLLDGEAEKLTRKAIELALDGDMTALRLCMERIVPARRDRPVLVDLPRIESARDASMAASALVAAVAAANSPRQKPPTSRSSSTTTPASWKHRTSKSGFRSLRGKPPDEA